MVLLRIVFARVCISCCPLALGHALRQNMGWVGFGKGVSFSPMGVESGRDSASIAIESLSILKKFLYAKLSAVSMVAGTKLE